MEKHQHTFSLIIPVYKQEKTVRRDIGDILEVLNQTTMPFEIIPVVDGYLDRSEKEIKKIADRRIKVVGYKTNHGKGYAVRYGFAHAHGDVIGFMDGGGDLDPNALPLMLDQFFWHDADIIIGSKRHPDSQINYPFWRKVQSWVYQQIVKILFGLNVRDTQVGMKVYKRKVLEDVLPRLLVKEFAFDVEMLAVAHYLGYTHIYEAPIHLDFFHAVSSITWKSLINIAFKTFRDTLAIFYRLHLLHYYDDTSKRKWRFDPELNFRINIG